MTINQTNVLNVKVAREDKDERHLCPLQLDVIERCVELYTNPGDTVYSPFMGIGSEGWQSIKMGRRFINSKRHTVEVDFDPYMRALAKERARGRERSGRVTTSV